MPQTITLPYGKKTISCTVPQATVLNSRIDALHSDVPGQTLVEQALQEPICSAPLHELAQNKDRCTILISDHTRPVPSQDILPPMLAALRRGNPQIAITLLVATGCHRATQAAELRAKLGEEIYNQEHIVIHDCDDTANNITLGVLPSGAPLVINRLAVETDLLLAEGFIEPHFFAGFSGGRKSVLPGVCDRVTVLGNHCSKFVDDSHARTGILDGNPIHADMLAAARMAKLAFIVNVVIDEAKQTVAAFAGHFEEAHLAGCAFLRQYCAVAAAPADIVVTSNGGAPMDQNIYQCIKGMSAAEASAKPGAVLIIAAECADGHGGESFYQMLKNCTSLQALYQSIMETAQTETIVDQWQSQIMLRALIKHRVIFVTEPELAQTICEMKMDYAATLEEALAKAQALKGADASLTVIPNGISVIVEA